MAELELVQATKSNGVWRRLRTSWERQLKEHNAAAEWAEPQLDHAGQIVDEDGADSRYGIFVACASKGGSPSAPYNGFVHINFRQIGTKKQEIRLVWNRLAPRFQFENLADEASEVQAAFIFGALNISNNLTGKPPVKMYLGNPFDQAFGRSFALIVNRMAGTSLKAAVRANWLHLTVT